MGFARKNGLGMDGRLTSQKNEPCSEIVNSSARLSPFEDFSQRSLQHLQGLWRRASYLAGLRSRDGGYEHWGLNRSYGKEAADQVLGEAHSEVYVQLLRRPISELMQDLEISAADAGMSVDQLLAALSNDKKKMVPSALAGGAPGHFNSVVLIACALRSAQRAATRPVA